MLSKGIVCPPLMVVCLFPRLSNLVCTRKNPLLVSKMIFKLWRLCIGRTMDAFSRCLMVFSCTLLSPIVSSKVSFSNWLLSMSIILFVIFLFFWSEIRWNLEFTNSWIVWFESGIVPKSSFWMKKEIAVAMQNNFICPEKWSNAAIRIGVLKMRDRKNSPRAKQQICCDCSCIYSTQIKAECQIFRGEVSFERILNGGEIELWQSQHQCFCWII